MAINNFENLSREYLNSFKDKDINKLNEMFDDAVRVTDWEIDIEGKDNILEFNKTFFNKIESLNLDILSVVAESNTVYNEISVNDLKILDVITFNEEGKITKINAYKLDQLPHEVLLKKKIAEIRKRDPFIYR